MSIAMSYFQIIPGSIWNLPYISSTGVPINFRLPEEDSIIAISEEYYNEWNGVRRNSYVAKVLKVSREPVGRRWGEVLIDVQVLKAIEGYYTGRKVIRGSEILRGEVAFRLLNDSEEEIAQLELKKIDVRRKNSELLSMMAINLIELQV